MAFSSRSRRSEDPQDLSQRYNRILLHTHVSRTTARRSTAHHKLTRVGSRASGVAAAGSDQDFLIEPRNIKIDESSLRYRDDLSCYVRISTEGLAGLVPNVMLGDGKYVLADPVRDMCEDIFGKTYMEFEGFSKVGKTLSDLHYAMDIVPQLILSGVPQIVRAFAARDRSWPSDDIISIISTGEFHLVARPAPIDPDREHDFCMSFAKAEVVLLRTMSVNQRVTIQRLKGIGRVIDFGRGALTSYHMKTSALWHFEKTGAPISEYSLTVIDILKRLDQYLNDRFLSHYFVPEMNLLVGISESDLIYVRRRLWCFIWLYLVTFDIEGIMPGARLGLAFDILGYASRQLSGTNPTSTQMGHMSHIRNTLEAAEVMYGTGIVSHDMKQRVSASVMARCPTYAVRHQYTDTLKALLTSFNKTINLWMYSKQPYPLEHGTFVTFMCDILNPTNEPLEEFFVKRSTDTNKGDGHAVRRELRRSEGIMNKWLAIVNDIIIKCKTCGNTVAGHVLRDMSHKSRADSHVGSNQCEENTDRLCNKITKELLTYAVGHIEKFSYSLDNDTYSMRPVTVGDFTTNLTALDIIIERMFLNVEYAILVSARIKASRGSNGPVGILMQTTNPESIEYRSFMALYAVSDVLTDFSNLCMASEKHQGWMEFMADTFR